MQNDMIIDEYKISTWYSEHVERPYMAVNMTVAIERLDGCNLTEAEKTNVSDLMAGYCRLVEESNLIGFGETEFESIANLFSKAKRVNEAEHG